MLHGHIVLCTYIIVITLMCEKERETTHELWVGFICAQNIENKIKGLYFNINVLLKIILF